MLLIPCPDGYGLDSKVWWEVFKILLSKTLISLGTWNLFLREKKKSHNNELNCTWASCLVICPLPHTWAPILMSSVIGSIPQLMLCYLDTQLLNVWVKINLVFQIKLLSLRYFMIITRNELGIGVVAHWVQLPLAMPAPYMSTYWHFRCSASNSDLRMCLGMH